MQKRYLLVPGAVAAAALIPAQQGPACPYAHAEASGARATQAAAASDAAPADGSFFDLGRSEAFAP